MHDTLDALHAASDHAIAFLRALPTAPGANIDADELRQRFSGDRVRCAHDKLLDLQPIDEAGDVRCVAANRIGCCRKMVPRHALNANRTQGTLSPRLISSASLLNIERPIDARRDAIGFDEASCEVCLVRKSCVDCDVREGSTCLQKRLSRDQSPCAHETRWSYAISLPEGGDKIIRMESNLGAY